MYIYSTDKKMCLYLNSLNDTFYQSACQYVFLFFDYINQTVLLLGDSNDLSKHQISKSKEIGIQTDDPMDVFIYQEPKSSVQKTKNSGNDWNIIDFP